MQNRYHYKLNGIEHEVILNHTLCIDDVPLDEKVLCSNKYMLKYINDFLDYNNIEYCLLGDCVLGFYVFNGINIFSSVLEIGILSHYIEKFKKCVKDLEDDSIQIQFVEEKIVDSSGQKKSKTVGCTCKSIFLDKIKIVLNIYFMDSEDDSIKLITQDKKNVSFSFYDIFPVSKKVFEDFQMTLPNKLVNVCNGFGINCNYIVFSKKKKEKVSKKKIVEEVVETSENVWIESVQSFMKSFF